MPYSLGKRFLSMILPAGTSLLVVGVGLVCLGAEEHAGRESHAIQLPPRELSAKERERHLAEVRAGIAKAGGRYGFKTMRIDHRRVDRKEPHQLQVNGEDVAAMWGTPLTGGKDKAGGTGQLGKALFEIALLTLS